MDSSDSSISASILTAAYLDKMTAEVDQYMAVYADFLRRIDALSEDRRTRSETQQTRPTELYQYKR